MSKFNKNWEIAKPLLLSVAVVIGMVFGSKLTQSSPSIRISKSDTPERTHAVAEALRYINSHYVDSLDIAKLNEEAMKAIFAQLDPHSSYIAPVDLKSINRKMQGHYKGIGIEFLSIEDTLYITKIIEDSPASRIGLVIGDIILSYNDILLSGSKMDPNKIASKMMDLEGDDISIKVIRGDQTLEFNTVREKVITATVPIAVNIEGDINYLKIESFNADTYREFMVAIEKFNKEGPIENLIIDVRDNPGGYLDAIIKIVSQLFDEKGKMIVYTEGVTSKRVEYKTAGRSFFNVGNIAVLVNEASASASEILAGAIQDHDRGLVIGKRTFGKGLVQEQYPLSNGGAIRLTVSRFYTPSGRSIQKEFSVNKSDYEREIFTRQPDSLYVGDSLNTFKTQAGRLVFGGGGINPDIFIGNSLPAFHHLKNIPQLVLMKDVLKVFNYLDTLRMNSPEEYWALVDSDFNISSLATELDFDKNTIRYISIDEQNATNYFIEKIMEMKFGEAEIFKFTYKNDPYIQKAIELFHAGRMNEILNK